LYHINNSFFFNFYLFKFLILFYFFFFFFFLFFFFFFIVIFYNKCVVVKVLKNKSLKECFYGYIDETKDICIPKDYEPNCLTGSEYKTCDDGDVESTDGQCGEGYGKCPYGECCKDGKCGTTNDFCFASNNCQANYGYCIDECEEIQQQIKSIGDDLYISCSVNENKKVQTL